MRANLDGFVDHPRSNPYLTNAKFYLMPEFDAEMRLFNAKVAFGIYGTFYGTGGFH
jgi:hypothetical protein